MSEIAHLLAAYPTHRVAFPVHSDTLARKKAFLRVCTAARRRIFAAAGRHKTIVVTGTNGKGSVVSILTSLLCNAGFRVGAITSPAQTPDCTDMIRVDGQDIAQARFLELLRRAQAEIGHLRSRNVGITHYMLVCHAAWHHFADCEVDFVIAETAIGGGYDPTVPFAPDFCIFTNVTREHLDVLGPTVDDVCRHKSHVIGPGTLAICDAEMRPSHVRILKIRAARRRASLVQCAPALPAEGDTLLAKAHTLLENAAVRIIDTANWCPAYQIANLRLAAHAFEQTGAARGKQLMLDAPAARPRLFPRYRFERLRRANVDYIFDCAHNEDSFLKLRDALGARFDIAQLAYMRAATCQSEIDAFADLFQPRKMIYVSGFHPRILHRPGFRDISTIDLDALEAEFGVSTIVVVGGLFLAPHIYRKVASHAAHA